MRGAPHSTSTGACTPADSNGSLLCRQHCWSGSILYLPWGSLKTICVLVIVLVPDSEHEVFPFEVDLRYPRPKIVSNLEKSGMKEVCGYGCTLPCFYFWELWYRLVLIPGSTQCCPPLLLGGDPHHTYQATSPFIVRFTFTLHMKSCTDLLQVSVFCLVWYQPNQSAMSRLNSCFHLLSLCGVEAKLGDIPRRMSGGREVPELSWNNNHLLWVFAWSAILKQCYCAVEK